MVEGARPLAVGEELPRFVLIVCHASVLSLLLASFSKPRSDLFVLRLCRQGGDREGRQGKGGDESALGWDGHQGFNSLHAYLLFQSDLQRRPTSC